MSSAATILPAWRRAVAERAKGRIKKKLQTCANGLAAAVKTLTRAIHDAGSDEQRLRILLKDWVIPLPTATAILTVLQPERFTVYDFRARDQLGILDFAGRKDQVERYFKEFRPAVAVVCDASTLRDRVERSKGSQGTGSKGGLNPDRETQQKGTSMIGICQGGDGGPPAPGLGEP